jgi:hypothetical protein
MVVAVLLITLAAFAASPPPATASRVDRPWQQFKAKHSRSYGDLDEESRRYGIFRANLAYIATENAKNHSFVLGVTPFADMTSDEFQQQRLGGVRNSSSGASKGAHQWGGETLPPSVDWQKAGATTPVADENQHGCWGACWAFSAAGSIEGAYQIKHGQLLAFSEQQFMDCSGSRYGNQGCKGGTMDGAFKYAMVSALCLNASYPYYGPVGRCQDTNCSAPGLAKPGIKRYQDVKGDRRSLMSAVAQQPVSVALHGAMGDKNAFQFYKGGSQRRLWGRGR